MVRKHELQAADFVYPLFVCHGTGVADPVSSMPGVCRYSLDRRPAVLDDMVGLGIPAVILFGIPERKDAVGSEAYADDGIAQRAVRASRERYPQLVVITDVCLCEYTDHGHCGLVEDGYVLNDETVELLAQTAVSHARAGAHIVAPSDMMDGRVAAIRQALDAAGLERTAIMSYAASSRRIRPVSRSCRLHAGPRRPQRTADGSTNGDEAVAKTLLDVEQGADMIIVKPALAFGDIVWRTKPRRRICPSWPTT